MFINAPELHAAHRQQLLGRRIRRRLRHLRPGELRHQHLPAGRRLHPDPRQASVRLRLRRPQGPVQLLQLPAGQRAVHLQRHLHRRRTGGPADRPVLRPDRRQRDFRLPPPDGHGRLRAGFLQRHPALQHQLRCALGAVACRPTTNTAAATSSVGRCSSRVGTARSIPRRRPGLIFSGDTAQDPYGKAFTASHWATFSPRLGLVWDPKGDGKQTIRAGFVLMHDTTELFYPERWTTNSPYVSSLTINSNEFGVGTDLFSNPFNGYTLNGKTGDPFPGAAVFPTPGTYITIPPNLPVTYMMQWNLSYQRQIAATGWCRRITWATPDGISGDRRTSTTPCRSPAPPRPTPTSGA